MRKKIVLTLPLCLMLFLSMWTANTTMAQPPANALEGTSWTLNWMEGSSYPVDGVPITIEFGANELGGHAGCNRYGSEYELIDGQIVIDGVFSTYMYCSEDGVMAAEQAFIDLLSGTLNFSFVNDGMLMLSNPTEMLILTPNATEQLPLTSTPTPTSTPSLPSMPEPEPPANEPPPPSTAVPCPEGPTDPLESIICGDPCDWETDCPTPTPFPPPPPGETFKTDGEIVELDDNVVVIETWMGRLVLNITDETMIEGELAVGAPTLIEAVTNADGSYDAIQLITMPDSSNPCAMGNCFELFEGVVVEFGEDVVVVETSGDRILFTITPDTMIEGTIAEGVVVFVEVQVGIDGTRGNVTRLIEIVPPTVPTHTPAPCVPNAADCVPPPNMPFPVMIIEGVVAELGNGVVVVEAPDVSEEGIPFVLTTNTLIEGMLVEGAVVVVEFDVAMDGSSQAVHIVVHSDLCVDPATGLICEPETVPTPTPTPTNTPGEIMMIDGIIAEFGDDVVVVEAWEGRIPFTITPNTVIEGTLAEGEAVLVEVEIEADSSYGSAIQVLVQGDPCIDPETSIFICSTGAPAEPEPIICWTGVIDIIVEGAIVIDGEIWSLNDSSEIVGELIEGALVYVVMSADGTVEFIEVLEETGDPIVETEPVYSSFRLETLELLNVISSVGDDGTVVIDGETIVVGADTTVIGISELAEGGMAFVYATRERLNEPWTAVHVEAITEMMTGEIEQIDNGTLMIDGQVMPMSADVRVMENVSVGDTVYVGQTSTVSPAGINTFIQPLTTDTPQSEVGSGDESVPLAVVLSDTAVTSASLLILVSTTMSLAVGTVVVRRD